MEARLQGEDLAGVEEGLKEYALLPPPRAVTPTRLTKLKDQAAKQQAEPKIGRPDQEHPGPVQRAPGPDRPLPRRRRLHDLYRGPGPEDAPSEPKRRRRRKRRPEAKGPGRRRGSSPASCSPRRRPPCRRRPRRSNVPRGPPRPRQGARHRCQAGRRPILSGGISARDRDQLAGRPRPRPPRDPASVAVGRGLPAAEELGELGPAAEEPLERGGREAVDLAVPGRHHPGELEHLLELLAGVLARTRRPPWPRCDAVLQQGDRRVHLAPLPLGHDDPERLHHVLERLEPVAAVADDVDPADHPPGDQLAEARRDVRPAHVQQLADLLGVERPRARRTARHGPGPSSG